MCLLLIFILINFVTLVGKKIMNEHKYIKNDSLGYKFEKINIKQV